MSQAPPAVYMGMITLIAMLGLLGVKMRTPRLRVALPIAMAVAAAAAALTLVHPLIGAAVAAGVVLQLAIEGV